METFALIARSSSAILLRTFAFIFSFFDQVQRFYCVLLPFFFFFFWSSSAILLTFALIARTTLRKCFLQCSKKFERFFLDTALCLFQQDGAKAHTSRLTQAWLAEKLPSFISKERWPANSPDLNPCDDYLWGKLKNQLNSRIYSTVEGLKQCIKEEYNRLPQCEIQRACASFLKRAQLMQSAEGGHFEKYFWFIFEFINSEL